MPIAPRVPGAWKYWWPSYLSAWPPWVEIAHGEIGTQERPGRFHSPRILEYQRSVNDAFTTDEIPWCSTFMNWVFQMYGLQGTGSGMARSWLTWGEPVRTPRRGAVVVFRRPPNPDSGHVGLWVGELLDYCLVMGGNQMNRVCVLAYPKIEILGQRWPKGA